MKKGIAIVLSCTVIISILAGCSTKATEDNIQQATTAQEVTTVQTAEASTELSEQPVEMGEDFKFIFDLEENYVGEYIDEYNGDTYVFKTYQATYCDAPYTDEWENAADYFKLNIKIPVKINDDEFDQAELANAPILFYNPWGGDQGRAVGEVDQLDNALVSEALANGWVIVLPGMRGNNCYSGTAGEDDYYNYGKLPGPLADLKAAVRYLRYESNANTIPGDKEQIWVAGCSSGGCATSLLGASGNSHFFDEALEEIGALPGRDDVFGVMPSCPVITREWGDPSIAWEFWGDLSDVEGAGKVNVALTSAYVDYLESLGITAEFDVNDTIKAGDPLNADNYVDYLMVYLKESALKYLNSLGGKEEIDKYLAEVKDGDPMYSTPDTSREWIRPVYDENNPDLVVDIEGTWEDFLNYAFGEELCDYTDTMALWYDKPMIAPEEALEENGVGNAKGRDYISPSSSSFGKPNDYVVVYSPVGQEWIQKNGIEINSEYLELLKMQRNSVDPLYFIMGEGASDATVCEHWYIRSGAVDLVVTFPTFVNLATALENKGINVNAAFVWDEGHGLTSDREPFFTFAEEAMENADNN